MFCIFLYISANDNLKFRISVNPIHPEFGIYCVSTDRRYPSEICRFGTCDVLTVFYKHTILLI
jgi:hypothetical protein